MRIYASLGLNELTAVFSGPWSGIISVDGQNDVVASFWHDNDVLLRCGAGIMKCSNLHFFTFVLCCIVSGAMSISVCVQLVTCKIGAMVIPFSLASSYFQVINSSALGQNGKHFADDIFRCIFMQMEANYLIQIYLSFFVGDTIDINSGNKPLPEPIMTHFSRFPWVELSIPEANYSWTVYSF